MPTLWRASLTTVYSPAIAKTTSSSRSRAAGIDADIPSMDFAIPLGVSYEYSHVVLDARYNFSLTNAISVLGESTKHSVFQITLGYKFGL